MRKNAIPAIIAFAPALLLPLIQNVVRPRVSHSTTLGFVLGWAPDFVAGFSLPFSILIRPRAWTVRVAWRLFIVWSILTSVAVVLVEVFSPFGPNVLDTTDIAAGIGGVALAMAVFWVVLRPRLTFAEDKSLTK